MVLGAGHPIVVTGLVMSLVAVGVGILALRSTVEPGRDHLALRAGATGLAAPLAVVAGADINGIPAPSGLGLSLGAVLATGLSLGLPRVSAWLSRDWNDGILRALGVAHARGLANMVVGLAIGASSVRGDVVLAAILGAAVVLCNAAAGSAIGAHLPAARRRIGERRLLMLVAITGVPVVPGVWAGAGTRGEAVQLVVATAGVGVVLSDVLALAAHVVGRTWQRRRVPSGP